MLKSNTQVMFTIEFNKPISDKQLEKLSVESITVKAYDNAKEKYKTAKFKMIKVEIERTDDRYAVDFYCYSIQPITRTQLKETDISWIDKGTIEIGGITNPDLKPTSVNKLAIRTCPDMISREIVEYTLCNIGICGETCNISNFKITIDEGSADIIIDYEAQRQTLKNFNTIAHR